MSEAILVLNAGSSSLKFSVFLSGNGGLELWLGGQAEALQTAPRSVISWGRAKAWASSGWARWNAVSKHAT